jgi:RNA polymerase sigma-70 factor (ECF subfamily)
LAPAFIAGLDEARKAQGPPPDLEAVLEGMLLSCARAWPEIEVDPPAFMRSLASRIGRDEAIPSALSLIHATDLYLAFGCASGCAKAHVAFERFFLSEVSAYLGRNARSASTIDEVQRELRDKLLVGEGAPKIATYAGRGPLAGWLRMCAARALVDQRRRERMKVALRADEAANLAPPAPDPELELLRSRYGEDLKAAFQGALSSLASRDAMVVKLYFLDGMRAEAIAAMLRVHARTVQRRIADARARILEETRKRLADRLQAESSDLESIMKLYAADLELSISRVLGDRAGE